MENKTLSPIYGKNVNIYFYILEYFCMQDSDIYNILFSINQS